MRFLRKARKDSSGIALAAHVLDDDTCPDAPSTEPSDENRRLRLIRCAGAEDCEAVCPMCWLRFFALIVVYL